MIQFLKEASRIVLAVKNFVKTRTDLSFFDRINRSDKMVFEESEKRKTSAQKLNPSLFQTILYVL